MAKSVNTEQIFHVMSCPQGRDDAVRERLLRAIETTYARVSVEKFLDAHGADLAKRSTGVREVIHDWLLRPTDFESVWATPLIDVYRNLGARPEDPVRAAAGLAAHIASQGTPCTWTAELREPVRLRWGHYLLPQAKQIVVNYEEPVARLRVKLPDGLRSSVTLEQVEGTWSGQGAEELQGIGERRLPLVLTESGVPMGCSLGPDVSSALVRSIPPDSVMAFSDAFNLIDANAPEYSTWVRRVVRDILVLRVGDDTMRSGSNSKWPGLVYMSVEDPVVLADNLVHEASHQYFHLLTRIEPVDDGSDEALYFSPVAGRDRPLRAILVAYHAFANVVLFLTACVRGGLDDRGYCTARLEEVIPKIRRLEEPLRENAALTSTGRALADPLMERMGQLAAA
jgi:HEXXH motif-containing protein